MKHTIKQEVTVRIALIFIVVIISGIVTVSGMSRIRGYSKSTEQSTEIHSLVLTAQKAHYGWVENLCSAIAMGTEFTGSKDYKTCVLGKWFYDSDLSTIDNAEIHQLIEEMKPIHQAIHESAQIILDMNQTDPEEAKRLYLEDTKVNVDQLVAILDKVGAITEAQVRENQSGLLKAVSGTEAISLGSIAITLIVCILLVLYVMSRIIRPLQTITESSRIETISDQFCNTMEQIHSSSSQVDSGANQVAVGAQSLAQGATEQASEVDNLQQMIEQITDQINNNAESAAITTEEADKVGEKITICNNQMHEMADAMEQISACSGEISKIIKTIEDIAFQTNILALNAAVEAARAGTAGKGFAVVADEVRNLAAKSADAAKNTTELIEKTLHVVDNGSQLTQLTQESLGTVVEGAEKVTEQIKIISAASVEQEAAINHIKDSIYQISTVIQSNSATSEESAAASQQLAGQAQVLKSLISKFRLK